MPIYMFKCPECKGKAEYLVRNYGGVPDEPCCACGSEGDMERIFEGSAFAVHTNTANRRSEQNRDSQDGLPNKIALKILKGMPAPEAIIGVDVKSQKAKFYKPEF